LKTSFFVLTLFTSFIAARALATTYNYDCTVQVFDDKNVLVIDKAFLASEKGGAHGGDGFVFKSSDGKTEVTAAADGHFMNLRWSKNSKLIAMTVTAMGGMASEGRAVILYNPNNTDEQANFGCQPKLAEGSSPLQ